MAEGFFGADFRGFEYDCNSKIRRELLLNISLEFKNIRFFESTNFERSPKILPKKQYQALDLES